MSEIAYAISPPSETRPTFRDRFFGMIARPQLTIARMTDPDAWFGAAILLLIGYSVYYLANGVGAAKWQVGMMSGIWNSGSQANQAASQAVGGTMDWLVSATQLFGNLLSVPFSVAISLAVRSGVFYLLARLMGGEKPLFGRVVSMVGWAWLPLFLQYSLVGTLMLASPAVMMFFLPLPEKAGMVSAADNLTAKWHGQMFFYLSPFVFWNLALCVTGVAEVFRLPKWKASIVVLVPAVIQLVYILVAYLMSAAFIRIFDPSSTGSPTGPGGP